MKKITNLRIFLCTILTCSIYAQNSPPPPVLEFYGDANIQKTLTSGGELPANTGIGVIYKEQLAENFKVLHSIEISLFINIASTADTLNVKTNTLSEITNKSEFGNSILLPTNSGQAFGFNLRGFFTKNDDDHWQRGSVPVPYGIISGGEIEFNGSNRNWADRNNEIYTKASNLYLYVGLFHEFIKREKTLREKYSLTLGLGITGRWIAGDISSDSMDSFRKNILGTEETAFYGGEINLALKLKNIKASVKIPIIPGKEKVAGLTGVQPNTFIGFTGGFELKLN